MHWNHTQTPLLNISWISVCALGALCSADPWHACSRHTPLLTFSYRASIAIALLPLPIDDRQPRLRLSTPIGSLFAPFPSLFLFNYAYRRLPARTGLDAESAGIGPPSPSCRWRGFISTVRVRTPMLKSVSWTRGTHLYRTALAAYNRSSICARPHRPPARPFVLDDWPTGSAWTATRV